MKITYAALAAAMLASAGAATAQTAADAKCLILSNAFAQQTKDENAQKIAQASFYFYLGRIGSQANAASMKALLDQQAKTLTEATTGPAMNNCIKELQSRMQLMESLNPKEPAQPQPQPPPKKPEGR